MKMKLHHLLLSTAICVSTASNAKEWELVNDNFPGVYEESSTEKAMMVFPCHIKDKNIPMLLADGTQPLTSVGQEFSFKMRVDKNDIHEISTRAIEVGGIVSMPIYFNESAFGELMNGNFLRVLWKLENGVNIIEVYSLKGFTNTFNISAMRCFAEERREAEEWFPDDGDETKL